MVSSMKRSGLPLNARFLFPLYSMTRFANRFHIGWLLLVTGLAVAATGARAQIPVSCDTSYVQARTAYYNADFEKALTLLRPCAQNTALSDSTRARMYRLLSFVHLGRNNPKTARMAVENLLDLRPGYRPDPNRDRPDFVALVRKAKTLRREEAKTSEEDDRRWVRWALGIATAALGTAAVLLFGDGGSENGPNPLPRPEVPPE